MVPPLLCPNDGSGLLYNSHNIILKDKAWQVGPQPLLGRPPFLTLFCVHIFDHSASFGLNHPSKSVWILDCTWGWMQRKVTVPVGPRPHLAGGLQLPPRRHWGQDGRRL